MSKLAVSSAFDSVIMVLSGSAFKPAGGFGSTNTGFGGTTTTGGGMFGATTSQPNQSFGGFGATSTNAGAFGSTAANTSAFGGGGGFGQQQVSGTSVKFNPVTGTDTMMKGGVQTNINTRHQVRNFIDIYFYAFLTHLDLCCLSRTSKSSFCKMWRNIGQHNN